MTRFKIFCLDENHRGNRNLIAGLLSSKFFVNDYQSAISFPGTLFLLTSGLNLNFNLDIIFQRKNKKTVLLIDYSFESGISRAFWESTIENINKKGISKDNIYFVLNKSAKPIFNNSDNIIFCDLFAISCVVRYKDSPAIASNKILRELPKKINLLLGKLDKPPRLQLIELFAKHVERDQSLISLLGYPKTTVSDQLFNFIKEHQGPLDNTEVLETNDGNSSQGWGSAYIYENSKVSLICETHNNDGSYFLTEKTYRPILNKQPFVIRAGFPAIEYLNSIGFRTFANIINEEYDQFVTSTSAEIEEIINQAKLLLDKDNEVQDIVDYNKARLLDYGESELKLLEKTLAKVSTRASR